MKNKYIKKIITLPLFIVMFGAANPSFAYITYYNMSIPDDCGGYVEIYPDDNVFIIVDCPPLTCFDLINMVCDYPADVDCEGRPFWPDPTTATYGHGYGLYWCSPSPNTYYELGAPGTVSTSVFGTHICGCL